MLKKVIESLDQVDEAFRLLYEKKADDKFHLKIEDDDAGALKRAKEHEKDARKSAEARAASVEEELKALKQKLSEQSEKDARDKGDIEAIEKSWQSKYDQLRSELEESLGTYKQALQHQTVGATARTMANELAGENAEILLPHIEKRLRSEVTDAGAKTRVLNEDGTPSALTVDELKKEFFTNSRFRAIIVASKANGGGAHGSQSGGAGQQKFSQASPAEKVAFKRKHGDDAYRKWRDSDSN